MTLNHIEPSPAEKARLLSGRGTHVWILEMPKPSGQDPAIKDIIKRYLSGDFKIIKNANGKPLIAANLDKELHISITHSGTIMVLALSFQKPFGIDIETLKERAHLERLRKRYFTEATPTLLDFYHAWTAREAFIKALGERLFLLKKPLRKMHSTAPCRSVPLSKPIPTEWNSHGLGTGRKAASPFTKSTPTRSTGGSPFPPCLGAAPVSRITPPTAAP